MRKVPIVVLALVGLGAGAASAQSARTSEQVKAFVEKAAAFYKSVGRAKALPAFSDPKGAWVDGDLYLIVMDAKDGKLTMLAHGVNKTLIGKPQIDIKDAKGNAFNRQTATALATGSEVWISYTWPNPTTKKMAVKKSYLLKIDDIVIGAGVYE